MTDLKGSARSTLQEIICNLKITELVKLVGAVASPFIILHTIEKFIGFSSDKFSLILASIIGIELILLILILAVHEIWSSRKQKYANITKHLHHCLHISRDIVSYLHEIDTSRMDENDKKRVFKEVIKELVSMLDSLSTIYSLLTGTRCRASIKSIYSDGDCLYVRSLARDKMSYTEHYNSDKKRYEDKKDNIKDNEDFDILFSNEIPGKNYFFCNNLPERRNYKSSSYSIFGKPENEIDLREKIFCHGWTLPYRSTIVWPIQQKENGELHFQEQRCIGFLAVDSESRRVFRERWDVWIGAGIADTIFHPINLLFSIAD
jgi:hypothetical protein